MEKHLEEIIVATTYKNKVEDAKNLLFCPCLEQNSQDQVMKSQSGRDKGFAAPLCSTVTVSLGAQGCPVCFRHAFGFLTS